MTTMHRTEAERLVALETWRDTFTKEMLSDMREVRTSIGEINSRLSSRPSWAVATLLGLFSSGFFSMLVLVLSNR